jgi:hypothetical protein
MYNTSVILERWFYILKQFKICIAMLLIMFTFFSPWVSTFSLAQETPLRSYTDTLTLDKRTINNGETTIWRGANNAGYLIPKGANISFQINVHQNSPIDMIVYKKNANGTFVEIKRYFTVMKINQGTSIGVGKVTETGFYAFAVRSYALNSASYDGYIMCSYD